jgi:glycosyltransferase involved in cell wall biosynthesis
MKSATREVPVLRSRSDKFNVAIYMPLAADHYRHGGPGGGGAELQTVLLARALAARGMRVAHIVFPVDGPAPTAPPSPSVIERGPDRGDLPLVGGVAEALSIWRSMARADASVYVFRTGRSRLLVGAMFCQAHRRKLVFAGANDLDFAFEESRSIDSPTHAYRAALRRTDAIVAQTQHQLELIRQGLGEDQRATMVPSFVEPAAPTTCEPDGFIWIGRLVPYKQPLEYVRLAEALPDRRFRMVFPSAENQPEEAQEISRAFVEELRSAAQQLPNLELIGQVQRDRVLQLIERSFAVVSTSTHEGMPNVFLEAWARAVPVLSLQCDPGGQIEAHAAGQVAGGAHQQLVELAASVSRDQSLRQRLGRNGRSYVNEAHDPVAVGDQWMALFDELLGSSRSRSQQRHGVEEEIAQVTT